VVNNESALDFNYTGIFRSNYYLRVLFHVVHIPKQALDGDLTDGITKEELLDGGWADGAQTGQQQQQATEARRLPRVPTAHLHRPHVTQPWRF
jgi:hypothetical protein